MTETTTPTEEVVDTSAGSQGDLPEDTTTESAVESVEDTASEETTEPGSNDSTSEDEPDKVDADLKRFAKSQGFDPENLTEGEIKALGIAHKQVKETRKRLESQSKGELEAAVTTEVDKDSGMSDREYLDFRINQKDMIYNVRDYWREHPEDVQYESHAVALLQEEKQKYGDEAMMRMASNMPRLVREAKYAAGVDPTKEAAEKGRKEERERLNKLQSGSADGAHASTTETSNKSEVTADWVKNEYDPTNAEHRAKLDAFMASGGKHIK